MRKKLILDLDTGIDDALAIAYALGSADEIDLIGITATYGNVAVPLAARNALAVPCLALCLAHPVILRPARDLIGAFGLLVGRRRGVDPLVRKPAASS